MPSSKATTLDKSHHKNVTGSNKRNMIDFCGSKRPQNDNKSTSKATASQRQTSIQSFFSTTPSAESSNKETPSSFPSTPPTPLMPLNPQTPPTPTELQVETDVYKGTPPSPVFATTSRKDRFTSKRRNVGTPLSTISEETETENSIGVVSAIPESPKELRNVRLILPETKRVSIEVESVATTFDTPQLTPPKTGKADLGVQIAEKKTTETPQSTTVETSEKYDASKRPIQKRKASQQLYLDFGQANFAKRFICTTCGMMYVHGLTEDSQQHSRICANHVKGVPFQTPIARVVATHASRGSIVEVRRTSRFLFSLFISARYSRLFHNILY